MIRPHLQTARRAVGVSSQQPTEETLLHAIAEGGHSCAIAEGWCYADERHYGAKFLRTIERRRNGISTASDT